MVILFCHKHGAMLDCGVFEVGKIGNVTARASILEGLACFDEVRIWRCVDGRYKEAQLGPDKGAEPNQVKLCEVYELV